MILLKNKQKKYMINFIAHPGPLDSKFSKVKSKIEKILKCEITILKTNNQVAYTTAKIGKKKELKLSKLDVIIINNEINEWV